MVKALNALTLIDKSALLSYARLDRKLRIGNEMCIDMDYMKRAAKRKTRKALSEMSVEVVREQTESYNEVHYDHIMTQDPFPGPFGRVLNDTRAAS